MSSLRTVSIAEVKALLEEQIQKRDPELVLYEQKLALDHALRTVKLDLEQTRELIKTLMELENVDETYAIKIADTMPSDIEEVRALYVRERYSITTEQIDAILEAVAKYR